MKTKAQKKIELSIKYECHRLMDMMFGTSSKERGFAYSWLKKKTGIDHFSTEHEYIKLYKARMALQERALKKGLLRLDELTSI